MERKDNSCFIIFLFLILVVGIIFGFFKLKEGATLGDISTGDGIEVDTRCVDKKIEGRYSLSIIYEKSKKNRLFEIQKMELRYEFSIVKTGCDISGTGKKLGYTVVDTLTSIRKALSKNEKEVEITGTIQNDTLNLIVSFVTESADDYRVILTFPFSQSEIKTSLDGSFVEKKSSSSGTAKLKKK